MSYKILIIEDDADICEVLKLQLELKQYQPIVASSYISAQKALSENQFDMFLIDRMLPDASGLDICRYLRNHDQYHSSPIILITAMAEAENIVEGLDAGADDYITKPFDINILHARVRAHLRRLSTDKVSTELVAGPLSLNTDKVEVKNKGEVLQLTNTEFQILTQLFENPGVVYSREKLIAKILGDEVHVTNRTIDTHIAGLRKKLGSASNQIETIRGVGYRLKEND